jgi:predicted short-subunit dehydrogenase-like oxidoreductase (DUF2520 family)
VSIEQIRTVIVGAGNVATQLGIALQAAGMAVVQVYSRTETSASRLASRLQVPCTADPKAIVADADLYIVSVNDDAIVSVLREMPAGNGLFVHTAGCVAANVFQPCVQRYGVFYPLQTFSREKDVSFRSIPILYEANNAADERLLHHIAGQLSDTVLCLDSDRRMYLHLAATFACNFVNHLYTLATEMLEEQQIPRRLLLPLIEETASRIRTLHPKDAQTGPAVRRDTQTMQKHLQLLRHEPAREIYRLLSESILSAERAVSTAGSPSLQTK